MIVHTCRFKGIMLLLDCMLTHCVIPQNLKEVVTSQCQVVLERLCVTGLESTYTNVLVALKEKGAKSQILWLQQLSVSMASLCPKQASASSEEQVAKFVEACINFPWKLDDGPTIRDAHRDFLLSLVTVHLEYYKSVYKMLFGLLIPSNT